jgi:cytochrome c oxidase assembly protein subunit 15
VTKRATITRRFAIATATGMLIVLLMGARVTATGSADGCGNDWPLCHGSFLPANTYESLTEYSHRLVTGAEGILVAITSILAWPMRRRYPEVKLFVPLMAGTLILQSLMGAAAVKWPQSAEVLATHFGISLICLASAALLARVLSENRPGAPHDPEAARRFQVSNDGVVLFRRLAITAVLAAIVVAYSGAYVRHTGAELACTSWPTCNGKLIPEFGGLHGIQTMHRIAALLISLLLLVLLIVGFRLRELRPDLFTISAVAMMLVLLQSISGLVVIETGLQLLATLGHAAIMSILFVTLCDSVRLGWKRKTDPETERIGSELPGMALGD